MTKLIEKYRFIRDDIFLYPQINTETGNQKLFLIKINLKSKKIEIKDSIDCIHTAITNIDIDTFDSIQTNKDIQEEFTKNIIDIRSSEEIRIIDLKIEEKFKAFKSWVAGITEYGMNSLKIQKEIEEMAKFQYPIVNFIMKFLLKADPKGDFFLEHLKNIEKECMFEGELHKSSFLANLIPIFEVLTNKIPL